MRKIGSLLFALHISFFTFAQSPKTYTSSEIFQQIKKLNVLASVLFVGAHPDDENNALLPYFSKEKLWRTAYLSLTRGDGGQNLLGDEQGIELGLIRTQELLAARRIDGAEQYFTRAYEFGFSKSAEESLRIWDKEKILSDVVWVIRKFQPDIIIKRFPPDKRAGHGHHAASAILADEAFAAAADPNKFPEQFKYGVRPWQAKRILWNTFNFGGTNTTSEDQLKIDIGGYNPLIGKSYGELGGEARTMHKSQGEGRPRRRGQSFEYFLNTGGEAPNHDLMDGIITDWKRIPGGEAIQTMVNAIITNYNEADPQLSVPALVKLYQAIKALPEGNWRNKKLDEVQQLIIECSALFVEATSSQSQVVQDDFLKINFVLNKRTGVNASMKNISLENFDSTLNLVLPTNQNVEINKTIHVADNKKISQPYWLVYPVKGELYEPIPVLPKVELKFDKDNYVSINNQPVAATLNVKSNIDDVSANYTVEEKVSNDWQKNEKLIQQNSGSVHEKNIVTTFTPQSKVENLKEEVDAMAKKGNEIYDGYTKTIAYDHIPTITYFPKAQANLVKLDIKIIGKKIGYIVGAGDKVPQALEDMGYEVTLLSEADLNEENLKQFDAIITGVRAYNLYQYLSDKNDVLIHYVENGGNLIVQYLKSNQVGQMNVKVGPYPFLVDPRTRVTEEDAKVDFLLPHHSALIYPNKITEKDFEGWLQERSTYQAVQLDPHYETPLGMHDTGEAEGNGSLAIAKYGKGNFVYASLVFFRELPAGVPGAYRLMANLIALPKNK